MLLGYARGKVGSMVFRRSKGEQITSAYNSKPLNYRTHGQVSQRSLFLCASKFFTRGVQNLFKFAYEDKKPYESDFNAFMRHNFDKGIYFTRAMNTEPSAPAIGEFLMSQGQLLGPTYEYIEEGDYYKIIIPRIAQSDEWGKISKRLIEEFNLMNGDIMTINRIIANGTDGRYYPTVEPEKTGPVVWKIWQGRLDVNSTDVVGNIFGDEVSAENGYLTVEGGTTNHICGALSVTISRRRKHKVIVSTSQLLLNTGAETAYMDGTEYNYFQEVLEWWQSQPDSILQGSRSTPAPEYSEK